MTRPRVMLRIMPTVLKMVAIQVVMQAQGRKPETL
jgi:hypothetical protein